ncbi:hypothetical protein ACFL1R_12210 [Candidatus Latescibacterota bacterium]
MSTRGVNNVIVALIALLIVAGTAFPQSETKEIPVVTIDTILNKAECPLTEKQVEQFKELVLSEGREVFRTIYEMFDEKQMEALKKTLGTLPGRNDRPDRPRYLMQVVVFQKAECPLTEDQLKELKELPNERGSWEKAQEIYTEKQIEELGKIFRRNR